MGLHVCFSSPLGLFVSKCPSALSPALMHLAPWREVHWSRREGRGSECAVYGLSDEPVIMENSLIRLQARVYGRWLLLLLQECTSFGQPAHSLPLPRLHSCRWFEALVSLPLSCFHPSLCLLSS